MNKLRMLSLCSGIGAIDLAAELTGTIEVVGQVEIDTFCQKVLAKHWPHVPRKSDIMEVVGDEFGTIDVVAGGIPCQPFSRAGKRKGTADDRHLWPYAFAIIKVAKPTWVLIENVAGFIELALDLITTDLEGEGYETQAFVLPALAVGAPHQRMRCFILAYTVSQGLETTGTGQQAVIPFQCGQDVANPSSQRSSSEWDRRDAGTYHAISSCSQDVAHAGSTGWQECNVATITGNTGHASWRTSAPGAAGLPQSRLGRVPARTSTRMDGDLNDTTKENTNKILPILPETDGTTAIQRQTGRLPEVSKTEILRSDLLWSGTTKNQSNVGSLSQESSTVQTSTMFSMSGDYRFACPPLRQRSYKQRPIEPDYLVCLLSHEMALEEWEKATEETVSVQVLRSACAEIGYVPETLSALQAVWRSLPDKKKMWVALRTCGRMIWPALPGQEQEAWEPPRVIKPGLRISNRGKRLKALGNAVVWQQIYPFFELIAKLSQNTDEVAG